VPNRRAHEAGPFGGGGRQRIWRPHGLVPPASFHSSEKRPWLVLSAIFNAAAQLTRSVGWFWIGGHTEGCARRGRCCWGGFAVQR
jgi:hypothetical protein